MDRQDLALRAPIVDEKTFTLITELEVRKAVRLEYFVSLLGIHFDTGDDPDARRTPALTEPLVRLIASEIRATDTIGRFGSEPRLLVLLVGANVSNILLVLERLRRVTARHGPELHGHSANIAIGASCFPSTARDCAELFAQVDRLVAAARSGTRDHFRYRIAPSPREELTR